MATTYTRKSNYASDTVKFLGFNHPSWSSPLFSLLSHLWFVDFERFAFSFLFKNDTITLCDVFQHLTFFDFFTPGGLKLAASATLLVRFISIKACFVIEIFLSRQAAITGVVVEDILVNMHLCEPSAAHFTQNFVHIAVIPVSSMLMAN